MTAINPLQFGSLHMQGGGLGKTAERYRVRKQIAPTVRAVFPDASKVTYRLGKGGQADQVSVFYRSAPGQPAHTNTTYNGTTVANDGESPRDLVRRVGLDFVKAQRANR